MVVQRPLTVKHSPDNSVSEASAEMIAVRARLDSVVGSAVANADNSAVDAAVVNAVDAVLFM